MKKTFFTSILFYCLFAVVIAQAQFPIGHRSITYQDPARSNRNVTTEIYYPATAAGNNTTVATGYFPLIVFGHGFVMGYDAYAYFKDGMTPLGYIIVFATTESSMSPVHAEFGADLAFLVTKLKSEGTTSASPFYNHVGPTSAIMGHSMGGGSSFLACANNTVPTCMVTFAAANTSNPTSISVAPNVSIPALIISGEEDCVAPSVDHQTPMYNGLGSNCKVFLSIKDGCHCYFGDYNFNCTFGESTCNPTPTLSRAKQQDVTLDFVKIYLDYYLKGNATSWTIFNDSLTASNRITYLKNCTTTQIAEEKSTIDNINIFPNPAKSVVNVSFWATEQSEISFEVYSISGSLVYSETGIFTKGNYTVIIPTAKLSDGVYTLKLKSDKYQYIQKIIIG